jgi:hypothetical protein
MTSLLLAVLPSAVAASEAPYEETAPLSETLAGMRALPAEEPHLCGMARFPTSETRVSPGASRRPRAQEDETIRAAPTAIAIQFLLSGRAVEGYRPP